jgi:hypothetical protein
LPTIINVFRQFGIMDFPVHFLGDGSRQTRSSNADMALAEVRPPQRRQVISKIARL